MTLEITDERQEGFNDGMLCGITIFAFGVLMLLLGILIGIGL